MQQTRFAPGKHIWGMAISLILLLVGGWLIIAPFALGYQPVNVDWTNQTINQFVLGICIAVFALIAFALFFTSLVAALRAAGIVAPRSRNQAQVAPAAYPAQAVVPQAAPQSDLDRTLTNLAAALAADLQARRTGQLPTLNQVNSDQGNFEQVNRRDA